MILFCFRCFTLFDELDQISTRFKKLQTDIIKRYTSTCIHYKDNTFLSVLNDITETKVIELPTCKVENDDIEHGSGEKSSDTLCEVNL